MLIYRASVERIAQNCRIAERIAGNPSQSQFEFHFLAHLLIWPEMWLFSPNKLAKTNAKFDPLLGQTFGSTINCGPKFDTGVSLG